MAMVSFKLCTETLAISLVWLAALDAAEAWSPSTKGSSVPIVVTSETTEKLVIFEPIMSKKQQDAPSRRQFFGQSATAFVTMQAWAANAEEEEVILSTSSSSMVNEPGSTVVADAADTETLLKDGKEVITEMAVDESEERKATEDTNKLISELEEKIKEEKESGDEGDSSSKVAAEEEIMKSTKNLIDTLEKEEEKIENETKELITKIETLEKAEELQQKEDPSSAPAIAETKEFLNKLKERVDEKEDLIARLKRESEKDVDPKTGKFKPMNPNEFKTRAPSDFDFLQYLKGSVTNNNEFERDLEAFKGLLESKFGPLMEQMRNAESRLAPVVDEVRRTATPLVESAVDEVRKAVQEAR